MSKDDSLGKNTETRAASKTARVIEELTIDASLEAAYVASMVIRHFVENFKIGDLWATKHSPGVAVAHLREAAEQFRAWQSLQEPLSQKEEAE